MAAASPRDGSVIPVSENLQRHLVRAGFGLVARRARAASANELVFGLETPKTAQIRSPSVSIIVAAITRSGAFATIAGTPSSTDIPGGCALVTAQDKAGDLDPANDRLPCRGRFATAVAVQNDVLGERRGQLFHILLTHGLHEFARQDAVALTIDGEAWPRFEHPA